MSFKFYMFKYTIVNGSYNNFVLASTLKVVKLIIMFSLIWLWKCKKKRLCFDSHLLCSNTGPHPNGSIWLRNVPLTMTTHPSFLYLNLSCFITLAYISVFLHQCGHKYLRNNAVPSEFSHHSCVLWDGIVWVCNYSSAILDSFPWCLVYELI